MEVYLKGKCKYAKLVTPDTKFGSQWSIVLYPDDESYKKLLELKEKRGDTDGILNVIKKDEDGYYVTFKRLTQKVIKGKLVGFNPPLVWGPDGSTPLPADVYVGNGSDVTVHISIYKYKKPAGGFGSAARLMAVRVDNLVPYKAQRDMTPEQQEQNGALLEQPEPLF